MKKVLIIVGSVAVAGTLAYLIYSNITKSKTLTQLANKATTAVADATSPKNISLTSPISGHFYDVNGNDITPQWTGDSDAGFFGAVYDSKGNQVQAF